MTEKKSLDNQVKYAQQHLANERTYLAWIRTAISIVGVGFLATSLHFTIGNIRNSYIDYFQLYLVYFLVYSELLLSLFQQEHTKESV